MSWAPTERPPQDALLAELAGEVNRLKALPREQLNVLGSVGRLGASLAYFAAMGEDGQAACRPTLQRIAPELVAGATRRDLALCAAALILMTIEPRRMDA
jgi:hypothetical protein